ncbi:hypothetical protein BKA93DRAFT_730114, partial [Sparassis latifolia]
SNSLGQSPCLVAAYAFGACQANTSWSVGSLQNLSSTYPGPTESQANRCTCSSVSYSLISACAACQEAQLSPWDTWIANCSSSDISNAQWVQVSCDATKQDHLTSPADISTKFHREPQFLHGPSLKW